MRKNATVEDAAPSDDGAPGEPQLRSHVGLPDTGISVPDLLDYVASFSDDFAGLALQSHLPRLALLLDMVAAEAKRERAG